MSKQLRKISRHSIPPAPICAQLPALNANAGFWIAAVVVLSLIAAAPFSWLIAPCLRARYWRRRLLASPSPLASAAAREF